MQPTIEHKVKHGDQWAAFVVFCLAHPTVEVHEALIATGLLKPDQSLSQAALAALADHCRTLGHWIEDPENVWTRADGSAEVWLNIEGEYSAVPSNLPLGKVSRNLQVFETAAAAMAYLDKSFPVVKDPK